MKNKHILSLTLLSALLAACGGSSSSSSSSGGPDVPDVCSDLNIEQCNEVTIPESSSSASSSSEAPPANDLLPLNEDFAVDNSLQFFSEVYKPLLNDNPEDPNNAFYYATSGLDSGRVVVADGKLTIGNARFTLGQRLETQGTHINPDALPADYKINTTTDGTAANFPTTTTWGDLDLAHPWKISFCVAEMEALSGSANNQQFMVYVDNNQSTSSFSIHGTDSLVKQLNVSNFVPGKRVEINIPGDVLVGGSVVDGVLQNPGTASSFIQLRVPSAGVVTMSKLWIGYQSDTATEPAASTCAADTRVADWNVALPAEAPTAAPSASSQDSQLAISWTALARASSYQLAYNTSDSVTGATLSEDIVGATTTSYTINGLQNNQTYFVFLRAKNSAGVYTDWSPSASAKPQAASVAPEAPAAPMLVIGNGQIQASWTAVTNANSYVVAYNTVDNANTASVFGDPTTDTSMLVTGLTNDVAYYLFVKAVNSAGDSAYSPSATATPVAPSGNDTSKAWGFDSSTYSQAIVGNTGTLAVTVSDTPYDADGLSIFLSNGTALRYRFDSNVWNFNGNSWVTSSSLMPAIGETVDALRAYIGVPIEAGRAIDMTFMVKQSGSGQSGKAILVDQDNKVLAYVDVNDSTQIVPLSLSLADGHAVTQVRIIYSREGTTSGGLDLSEIRKSYANSPLIISSSSSSSEASSSSDASVSSSSDSSAASSSDSSSSASSDSSSSADSSAAASDSSSSVSSDVGGGSSSASSVIAVMTEDFVGANETNFFTTDYKTIPGNSALPLYIATSGSTRITFASNELSMYNARFTIGDTGVATTSSTQPNGSYDLSKPYRIKMTITAAAGTGNFQVYVDNNTTSSGNSIHGTASRLIQMTPADIPSFPYELVIDSSTGTANSFLQIRADSNITNLTISNISIEYQ